MLGAHSFQKTPHVDTPEDEHPLETLFALFVTLRGIRESCRSYSQDEGAGGASEQRNNLPCPPSWPHAPIARKAVQEKTGSLCRMLKAPRRNRLCFRFPLATG
ncbi:hypothetical protein CapIbe_016090 [Capra ibex]